jgi:hypothetical protein
MFINKQNKNLIKALLIWFFMTENTFEQRIASANMLQPCIGTYNSRGNDGKNRIQFIQPVKEIFSNRKDLRGWGILLGQSIEAGSIKFISLWDYFPEMLNPKELYYIKLDREKNRLYFPKEIILPNGKLIWKGEKDHFQIWQK